MTICILIKYDTIIIVAMIIIIVIIIINGYTTIIYNNYTKNNKVHIIIQYSNKQYTHRRSNMKLIRSLLEMKKFRLLKPSEKLKSAVPTNTITLLINVTQME